MKPILLLALLVIGGANLHAQVSGGVSNEVQPLHLSEHPMTASQVTLPSGGGFMTVQGEQPLWQYPSAEQEPLGDVARRYRDEWKNAPKSKVRLEQ